MEDDKLLQYTQFCIDTFIDYYKIKTETGAKYELTSHAFLLDILNDVSALQVWLKAAQLGLSTAEILKVFWIAKYRKLDIIYTLPTSDFAWDFVRGKVNRIISQNTIFQQWVKNSDTIEQKEVGNNIIYFRGAQTEKQAISVSADLLVHDEDDRSDQEIINQYQSRLQHSKYKWRWHFSNPSIEGTGVHKYWIKSDQKEWFIKCEHCGRRQFMEFPESIDERTQQFVCKFLDCRMPLKDEDRRCGHWVKRFKDREWSGYHLPLFIAPWITAKEILQKQEDMTEDIFCNFVLGLPYHAENSSVPPDVIYRNLSKDNIDLDKRIVIGCDSGLVKHYVIGTIDGIFEYGKTDTWEDIEKLMQYYPNSLVIIDALPDLTRPRELKEKYKGRVFLGTFGGDNNASNEVFVFGKKKEYGTIRIQRNRAIQLLVGELSSGRLNIFGDMEKWQEYASHWKTMYRVIEETDSSKRIVWKSTNKKDHYCFATALWRAGVSRFSGRGEIIGGKQDVSSLVGATRQGAYTFDLD